MPNGFSLQSARQLFDMVSAFSSHGQYYSKHGTCSYRTGMIFLIFSMEENCQGPYSRLVSALV